MNTLMKNKRKKGGKNHCFQLHDKNKKQEKVFIKYCIMNYLMFKYIKPFIALHK